MVNSVAYRRALGVSKNPLPHLAPVQEQSEVSSRSDTLVDVSAPIPEAQQWMIPVGVRSKLSTEECQRLWWGMQEYMKSNQQADARATTILEQLQNEFATMKEKYVRVKRLYFDLTEQKEANLKQIDICNKEIETLRSRLELVEVENASVLNQVITLRQECEQHEKHFLENRTVRANLGK